MCLFQGEKECLNSETTELKQKIRYLQDQLLPLSKQREYQEKEIQRLNRVSVLGSPLLLRLFHRVLLLVFQTLFWLISGFRGSLKPAHPFIIATATWSE